MHLFGAILIIYVAFCILKAIYRVGQAGVSLIRDAYEGSEAQAQGKKVILRKRSR